MIIYLKKNKRTEWNEFRCALLGKNILHLAKQHYNYLNDYKMTKL